ncbi:hypothetical protein EDD85DRAFT_792876 [Armillaria nabsnona]|nr:hypothetical protein EDD85DRAFT_792876 [Armillaria nabsnona]
MHKIRSFEEKIANNNELWAFKVLKSSRNTISRSFPRPWSGCMQIVLSFKIKVVFCASSGSKSPGWRASHPHQHKPLNEAAPHAMPINDHHDIPNIDIDDYECTCPAAATKLAPPSASRPTPHCPHRHRAEWSMQGETGHDDDDKEDDNNNKEDNNNNGGRGGNSLLRGGLLEQERVEGARWRAGEIEEEGRMKLRTPTMNDDDDDQAFLGVKGQLKGATIAPITIHVRPLPPALPKSNIGLLHALQPPNHPRFMYLPVSGWGNMNPTCARPPDAPVIVHRHRMPIPSLSALFSPLPPTHRCKDLTTPVFDIGESSGECLNPFGCCIFSFLPEK